MDDINVKIKTIIGDLLGIEAMAVADDIDFIDDLGIDSLEAVELVMALEERFGLHISDSDCADFTTVEAVVAHIKIRTLQPVGLEANMSC